MIKKFFINLILLIVSIFICLIFAEIALRFTPYKESLYVKLTYPRYYDSNDRESGFDLTKNFMPVDFTVGPFSYKVWTNQCGCFDRPYKGEKSYALLVGDSFTWGFAPFTDKWGTIIEEKLGVRVLKCGVGGYGTKQQYLKIKKVVSELKIPPKLIIVGYFMNDLQDDYLFPLCTVVDGYLIEKVYMKDIVSGEKGTYSEAELRQQIKNYKKYSSYKVSNNIELIKAWLREHSIIYHLFQDATGLRKYFSKIKILGILTLPKPAEEFSWIDTAWEENSRNLLLIKKLADELGAKLVFVIIPENYQVYDFLNKNSKNDLPQFGFLNQRLRSFFEKEGIDCLDLAPEFRKYANLQPRRFLDSKNDLYYRYDGHWTVKGNLLAGLLVSKYLLENNLIDTNNSSSRLAEIKRELNEFHSR